MDGELNMKSFYYSELAFYILRKWIALALTSTEKDLDSLLSHALKINPKLKKFLIEQNINKSWNAIRTSPSEKHFIKSI